MLFEVPESAEIGPEEREVLTRVRSLLAELGPAGQHVSARITDGCARVRITHPQHPELWLELAVDAGYIEIHWPRMTDVDLFDADDLDSLLRGVFTTGVLQRRRVRLGRVAWSSLYVRSEAGVWEHVFSGGGFGAVLRLLPIPERVEALTYSLGEEPGVRVVPDPMPG